MAYMKANPGSGGGGGAFPAAGYACVSENTSGYSVYNTSLKALPTFSMHYASEGGCNCIINTEGYSTINYAISGLYPYLQCALIDDSGSIISQATSANAGGSITLPANTKYAIFTKAASSTGDVTFTLS